MAFVGEAQEDASVQKAYGILQKRGYTGELSSVYWTLLGVLHRGGENELYNYAENIELRV